MKGVCVRVCDGETQRGRGVSPPAKSETSWPSTSISLISSVFKKGWSGHLPVISWLCQGWLCVCVCVCVRIWKDRSLWDDRWVRTGKKPGWFKAWHSLKKTTKRTTTSWKASTRQKEQERERKNMTFEAKSPCRCYYFLYTTPTPATCKMRRPVTVLATVLFPALMFVFFCVSHFVPNFWLLPGFWLLMCVIVCAPVCFQLLKWERWRKIRWTRGDWREMKARQNDRADAKREKKRLFSSKVAD